jgi:PAS domain S-box-containing protein
MNASNQPLRALVIEDSENDAALISLELENAGFQTLCRRVDTAEGVASSLTHQKWDVVIADYSMPHFDGLSALAMIKERELDLPFIIVSGVITDDKAVAAMKAGAHDYVMKDNLCRLGPAVQRELREAEGRRARRISEEKLKVESAFRRAIEESIPSGISVVDLDGRQTYVNPAFCALVGWSETELVGAKPPFAYWPPEHVEFITGVLGSVIQGKAPPGGIELPFLRNTGERIHVLLLATPLKDDYGNVAGWVSSVSNISLRKRAERRLAAEHAVTRLLAQAPSLDEAGPEMLRVLLEGLDADCGAFWVPDPNRQILAQSALLARSTSPELELFLESSRHREVSRGAGLPGRVWQEGRAVWVPELQQDKAPGAESAIAAGLRSALALPLESHGTFFGVLELFSVRHLEPDPGLVNMLTAVSGEVAQFVHRRTAEAALRNAHDELELRVRQRTAELKAAYASLQSSVSERKRLEHELLDITEKERRRIGLDLHDDLGQQLSGIGLMTRGLELTLAKRQAPEAREAGRIHSLIQQAMTHTREVVRDLAPLDPKQDDLGAALNNLADHASTVFGISCSFKTCGDAPRLEAPVTTQLCKIVQEAITNAARHGKAKTVEVSLSKASDKLLLTVQNSGLPFPDIKSHPAGLGLRIMSYRANLIGASLQIKAAGDCGTLLTCSLPLTPKVAAWFQT